MKIKNYDKILKGTPVKDLAQTEGVEGYLVRTQVLKRPRPNERASVRQAVAAITSSQLPDGSWNGSVIETSAQAGRLLAYGVPSSSRYLQKVRKWLFSQRLIDHPVWTGMFAESRKPTNSMKEARGGRPLRALYAKQYRHQAPEACCSSTPIVATCCALEVLFALGDDVSNNRQLASAVDRILELGNARDEPGRYGKGICGGQFSKWSAVDAPSVENAKLWRRHDNRIFRMPAEVNPGMPICAHHLLRTAAKSPELASSPLVTKVLSQWEKHQLPNGNFDSNRAIYDFYQALDTLTLLREHEAAQRMTIQMIPAILRRQKKDGRWWKKEEWIDTTFSAIWTLHAFDLLDFEE